MASFQDKVASALKAGESSLVGHDVKYKKKDGYLCISDKRLLLATSDKLVAVDITDVKSFVKKGMVLEVVAQIKAGSTKKLQFTCHGPSAANNLHAFINALGNPTVQTPRVKAEPGLNTAAQSSAAVQRHPPAAPKRSKVTAAASPSAFRPQAKLRAELLVNDAELNKAYKSLVTSGLLTPEEFWENRREMLQNEEIRRQKVGLQSAMGAPTIVDVAANHHRYELNRESITQIFVDNPAVERAYKNHVPHNISEQKFWELCFGSGRVHNDGLMSFAHSKEASIFAEAERQVENEPATAQGGRKERDLRVDPSVDLLAADAKLHSEEELAILRQNEVARRNNVRGGADLLAKASRLTIERINRHANKVVESNFVEQTAGATGSNGTGISSSSNDGAAADAASLESKRQTSYHNRLAEEMRLMDLESTHDHDKDLVPLELKSSGSALLSRLMGGAGAASSEAMQDVTVKEERTSGGPDSSLAREFAMWRQSRTVASAPLVKNEAPTRLVISRGKTAKIVRKSAAATDSFTAPRLTLDIDNVRTEARSLAVLQALSASAQRSQRRDADRRRDAENVTVYNESAMADEVAPPKLLLYLEEINKHVTELLRHFYQCFPPDTPELRAKMLKTVESIDKVHKTVNSKRNMFNQKGAGAFVCMLDPPTRRLERALTYKRDFDQAQEMLKVKRSRAKASGDATMKRART